MENSNRDCLSSLSDKQLSELRETLINELNKYSKISKKKLIIPRDKVNFIDGLIFDYNVDKDDNVYKTFALSKKAMSSIDFRNFSFSYFNASGVNFKRLSGINLNPQTLYKKDLSNSKFGGVKFQGSFDDCIITGADFSESEGAVLNPQTIKYRCFNGVVLKNIKIDGVFDDCSIRYANFRRSLGAVIDPQKIRDRDLSYVKFADALVDGSFDGCKIVGASFAHSKGAVIDPQKIDGRDLSEVNLKDARVIGYFDGCNVESTKFDGMIDEVSASKEYVDKCKKLIYSIIDENK